VYENESEALAALVNRPPEFVEDLPQSVSFIKDSDSLQMFEYILPQIIDLEGHSFEIKVSRLVHSFMKFENNRFTF
jgi:hypothetical protein